MTPRTLRSGAVALVATGLALSVMQAPASAAASAIVRLPGRARLSSTGKTALVRVTITCKDATPAPITVDITQTRATTTVTGSGQSGIKYRCNGLAQHVPVAVTASSGRFRPGGAHADADVTVSGATDTASRDITLVAPA